MDLASAVTARAPSRAAQYVHDVTPQAAAECDSWCSTAANPRFGFAQSRQRAGPPVSEGKDAQEKPIVRKDRVHQSVCRWCYPRYTLDELCAYGARIGLNGIDLLNPEEFEIPRKYGIVCSMGYADAGTIKDGVNNRPDEATTRIQSSSRLVEAYEVCRTME